MPASWKPPTLTAVSTFSPPSKSHLAAVNDERMAGDVCGVVGCEERDRRRDLLSGALAIHRHILLHQPTDALVIQMVGLKNRIVEPGVDPARTYAVAADPVASVIDRHVPREVDDRSLRCVVGSEMKLSHDPGY